MEREEGPSLKNWHPASSLLIHVSSGYFISEKKKKKSIYLLHLCFDIFDILYFWCKFVLVLSCTE